MAVKQRGSGWQADVKDRTGKRHRPQYTTEAEARRWEAAAKEAIRLGKPLPPYGNQRAQGFSISTLDQLLRHVERHRWKDTKAGKAQAAAAKQVVDFIGPNRAITEITGHNILEFVEDAQERGVANSTINRKLSGISVLLTVAKKMDLIAKVPEITRYKEYEGRIRYLTRDEYKKLLKKLERLGAEDVRDFVIVAVATGMRRGELLKARWADFIGDFQKVTVWETKSDKPRTLKLNDDARGILQRIQSEEERPFGPFHIFRQPGEMALANHRLRRTFERAVELCGWDDVVIHTLRHTCASWLVQGGKDLRRVQKWMGHKRIETTLRYAHLAPDDLDECADTLLVETKCAPALAAVA